MKPVTPHDPLDDLIAAALHGELTPEERTQFESRLQTDAAAQAAYRKAQAMHDLLEKTHKEAQPDSAFEQRMVSGVRRKIETDAHRETAWESFVALWRGVKGFLSRARKPIPGVGSPIGVALVMVFIIAILSGVALGPITHGIKKAKQSAGLQTAHTIELAEYSAQVDAGVPNPSVNGVAVHSDGRIYELAGEGKSEVDVTEKVKEFDANAAAGMSTDDNLKRIVDAEHITADKSSSTSSGANTYSGKTTVTGGQFVINSEDATMSAGDYKEPATTTTPQGGTVRGSGFEPPSQTDSAPMAPMAPAPVGNTASAWDKNANETLVQKKATEKALTTQGPLRLDYGIPYKDDGPHQTGKFTFDEGSQIDDSGGKLTAAPPAIDDRKLIRNAQLDLEVKSFQDAMDKITALTKAAGGYVDTSNSQKGGNGKLQGTVVVKVLPQNLDDFLLKLRDLGVVQNQSVSTDDVTKDYFDTQARLVNSQKMEAQLQDLLKRENSKVADLLAVERELARVRGEIEQMQGQLKLYDFQVQYATVTMNLSEKDLNQAAAYLLKEQDDFSLFATDVEATFQKARQAADDFKAQVLTANLNHNSGTDVSAELEVMVAPEQIEPFLAEVRGLGRVANFTRATQRVAKDGGDSTQPADETKTENDKVQVHITIRSDDETRKQVSLTVVAKAVDVALDEAKTAAMASAGTEILSSSLNKAPEGQSSAQLSVRVPGTGYSSLMEAFKALGRTASLSIQRSDDSGPGANGDDAPVIVTLALTDDDAPLQQTAMTVAAQDVDAQSQQIKKAAGDAGVEVKASSFQHQTDGTELAQMTFRLPMAKYPAFLESVKALGKVESLTVQRNDRPDETQTDDTAPAEITLQLHNQRDLIADDDGFWATMSKTFGEGAGALLTSVRVIGVIVAFVVPWALTLGVMAWVGRRIYVWRKKKV